MYQTITTGDGWDAWFTNGTTVDFEQGRIKFRWENFGPNHVTLEDGGAILKAVPYSRFDFQWHPGETVTTVSFRLENRGKGTLVSLKESGYSKSDRDLSACIGCSVGWGEALTLLKFFLEHKLTYGEIPFK